MEFCPISTYFVSPESGEPGTIWGNEYLNEYWNRTSSLHSVRFFLRFEFEKREIWYGNIFKDVLKTHESSLLSVVQAEFEGVETVYAHCEAKICPKDQESTCSTEQISDGQERGQNFTSKWLFLYEMGYFRMEMTFFDLLKACWLLRLWFF